MWPTSWSPDISSFYCSDINKFLIDYAWCKLWNKWLLLFENNSRSLTLEENIVAVITQDMVIDDNLKRKIKNRTLHTCNLFQLTWISKYISNWSKVFYPPSFFNIHNYSNKLSIFHFFIFSWLGSFIYKLGQHFSIRKLPNLNLYIKSHPLLR